MMQQSDEELSDLDNDSWRRPTRSSRRSTPQHVVDKNAWLAPEVPPNMNRDGKYLRPYGRAPVDGYEWNSAQGMWVPGRRLLQDMLQSQNMMGTLRTRKRRRKLAPQAHDEDTASSVASRKQTSLSASHSVLSDMDTSSEAAPMRRRRRSARTQRKDPPLTHVETLCTSLDDNFSTGPPSVTSNHTPPTQSVTEHQLSQQELVKEQQMTVPSHAPTAEKTEFHPGSNWEESCPTELDSELTLYEKDRKPRPAPTGRFQCHVHGLRQEFRCVICLDYIANARLVRECLHRFCEGCIEKVLSQVRKECPICRTHIPSRRSLAPDPDFDKLIRYLITKNLLVAQTATEAHDTLSQTRASRILQRAIRNRISTNKHNKNKKIDDSSNMHDEVHKVYDTKPSARSRIDDSNKHINNASPQIPPSLMKIVLLRAHGERTILVDLHLPFLTISDDAPIFVLHQFLWQKYGFRPIYFDILLYKNDNATRGDNYSPVSIPTSLKLRDVFESYSALLTERIDGYLPLYYKSRSRPPSK